MKALKKSPMWVKFTKPTLDAEGKEVFLKAYSQLPVLQIHVRGITRDGKHITGWHGKGSETLFVNLGTQLKNDTDPNGVAKKIHDEFMIAPKLENEVHLAK